MTANSQKTIAIKFIRRWKAKQELNQIADTDPTAILPTVDQLIAAEDNFQVWNFETGQPESITA